MLTEEKAYCGNILIFQYRNIRSRNLPCPQNYYYAWGENCIPNKKFEALTRKHVLPGYHELSSFQCRQWMHHHLQNGMLVLRSLLCSGLIAFLRSTQYSRSPVYLHHCGGASSEHNARATYFAVYNKDSSRILLEKLSSYNQGPLHLSDFLVIRVGDPSEAYLLQTSPPNRPIARLIGQVQANESFTKNLFSTRI
ncbi:hypothetical protein AVEN_87647-1 [Araneus ventricosus]|uniref:Uncharacterized protein n=1 Tax=Araneus ventricosus TaxID=182803 RepID=A0A4Y2W1C7_ARAVE|nr:hypothetical protein AVEN_85027-1 [Araneus ventricosus]GBO30875.1 hypothetical protein AVEN_87647-1 [Araneus ventricosus]